MAELAGCGTSSDERSTPCVERIMRHRDEAIKTLQGATCLRGKIARRLVGRRWAKVRHVCMAQPGADMDPATLPPTAQWMYNILNMDPAAYHTLVATPKDEGLSPHPRPHVKSNYTPCSH